MKTLSKEDKMSLTLTELRHVCELQARRIEYQNKVLIASAWNVEQKQRIINKLITENAELVDKIAQLEAGMQNLLEAEIRAQAD